MKKKWGLLGVVACVIVFLTAGDVCAITVWDGKLDISGYYRNTTAFRLRDGAYGLHGPDPAVGPQEGLESGDLFLFRNVLQLELTWDLTDNITFFGIYRGVYDGAMDLNSDYEDNIDAAGAGHKKDAFKKQNDLREYYLDIDVNKWHLRVGMQQWQWGEADGLRMADIINPLDLSWHYVYAPAWEDIRIPMFGFDLSYSFQDRYDHTLNFVFLPATFDYGWVPRKFAPAGAHFAPPGFSQVFLGAIEASYPDKDLRSASFGVKIKGIYKGWDISLFDYYSRHDGPTFQEDWLVRFLSGGKQLFQYPYTNKIGGTVNVYNEFTKAFKSATKGSKSK